MKAQYDGCCDGVKTYIWATKNTEERLNSIYSKKGVGYKLKYSSIDFSSYDSLISSTKEIVDQFNRIKMGDMIAIIPQEFVVIKEDSQKVLLRNKEDYYLELQVGQNMYLRDIEDDPNYEVSLIQRHDKQSEVRYVLGSNQGIVFYYNEEFFYPNTFYSWSLVKMLNANDDKENVESILHQKELLLGKGITVTLYWLNYWLRQK